MKHKAAVTQQESTATEAEREATFGILREICVSILTVRPEEVTPEVSLRDGLGADSLDFAELSMALEDHGVVLSEEDVRSVDTVADLMDIVLRAPGRKVSA
ncbi:acyl carrier protein [Allonocardiopsis opalescens]|uniref:Acyl carrier protein n=1 Tax=Allonocardiopsis opalescens TaxID=1144618 RepID=A0A2T0QCF0_9ACTN|nr:acyl carrier protein [Allonocardiopsis opalescens]PRY01626.1 acyl carrier protein [Allonocardiopsis opalescens]